MCESLHMTEQPAVPDAPVWDVADRMRKALRQADIGVQEMAGYLDVSRNTVSTWINGRIPPSTQTIRLWAMKTGVSYEWLCHGSLDPCRPGPGNVLAGGRTGSNYMQSIITGITALRLAA